MLTMPSTEEVISIKYAFVPRGGLVPRNVFLSILSATLLSTTVMGWSLSAWSQQSILIEEEEFPDYREDSSRKNSSSSKYSIGKGYRSYNSADELRADRHVGLGIEGFGKLGLIGFTGELVLADGHSALVGFGGGRKYSCLQAGWRYSFTGINLIPFAGVAYSKWFNNSNTGRFTSDSDPDFLTKKLLSDEEIATGYFSVDTLSPSVGLQYYFLNDTAAGISLHWELMMLLSVRNFQRAFGGAVGVTFYF